MTGSGEVQPPKWFVPSPIKSTAPTHAKEGDPSMGFPIPSVVYQYKYNSAPVVGNI